MGLVLYFKLLDTLSLLALLGQVLDGPGDEKTFMWATVAT